MKALNGACDYIRFYILGRVGKQVSLLRTVSKKMKLNLANLVCCWFVFIYLFFWLLFELL